jgi:SNF2 family DNA or RNA helicase
VPGITAPSLRIGFDITRTKAVLRTVAEHRTDLARLVARYSAGRMRGAEDAEIPLESFLAGIDDLADWPDPDGVSWDDDLATLVGDVLDDAGVVEDRLGGADSGARDPGESLTEELGADWQGNLTSFQRRDVARLLSLRHGANFSVPGAGKTRTALALFATLRELGEVRRMLVVCPKSAYEAWQEESAICFAAVPRVHLFDGRAHPAADILVVNYERLDRSLTALAGWVSASPTMLVLDEAHRMKRGSNGVYGAACMSLGPLAKRRLILTGTPAPNGARDLENLFSFVWPGHGRLAVTQAVGGGDLVKASAALRPLFTRTTKRELGLPPVTTMIRYLPLPPLHREIYDALIGRYSTRAEASRTDLDALGKAMLRLLMAASCPALLAESASAYEPLDYRVPALTVPPSDSLYQLLQDLPGYELSPKYQEALAIAAANAEQGRKTLIWTGFVRGIKTLEVLFEQLQPAVVHGGTPDRDEQLRRFREDPECAVLLSNPATLGEGISLHHACHDAVYIDRDFQAGRFLQSLDRIHRLGLAVGTTTTVTILASEGTVDEIVAHRLEEKLTFMGQILDDPDVQQLADLAEEPPVSGGMDAEDVSALLGHLSRY